MLEIFKSYDLIDEINKNINEEEDVFAECRPNKFPFLFRRVVLPIIVLAIVLSTFIIYMIIRPKVVPLVTVSYIFLNLIDWIFFFLLLLAIAFLLFELYFAILDMKCNYYVIATDGIHLLYYDNRLTYACIRYKDIKSVILKKNVLGTGDIVIKEKTDKENKKFIDKLKFKLLFKQRGMFGVDNAQKVFDVIKTIAIQDNDTILFADPSNNEKEVDYFQSVKKYKQEIKRPKETSVMEKRNNIKE